MVIRPGPLLVVVVVVVLEVTDGPMMNGAAPP